MALALNHSDDAPASARRVVVLGGRGQFGAVALRDLRACGLAPVVAARTSGADLDVDADDPQQVRATFRCGDLVVDAAGPFQGRSLALLEAAIERGFDIIDLNDCIAYAERVATLEERIEAAGIRVLSSASSVSAIGALLVARSGIDAPARVSSFIAPATRHTARPGSARSLIRSVGRPVRVWRDGGWQTARGWSEPRAFPMPAPVGAIHARLFESADSFYLPRIWPTLRRVETFVDTNTLGLNTLLRAAARLPWLRRQIERHLEAGARVARLLGSAAGGLGYEVEGPGGQLARLALVSRDAGPTIAVAPAVIAARAICAGRFRHRGLVRPDRQVDAGELEEYLRRFGVQVVVLGP